MRALVTGGASSGKSAFAEQLALALPQPHVYVATMRHGGAETEARIERHRRMRAGKGFATVELAETPEAFAPGAGTVLLEDLSNLVVNDCTHLLPRLLANDNVVVVANEIGADGVLYDAYTSDFIAQVGALACGIAAKCDLVVEVVAGQPVVMKGALPASVSVVGRATPQVRRACQSSDERHCRSARCREGRLAGGRSRAEYSVALFGRESYHDFAQQNGREDTGKGRLP